jgi:hypothetical protein
LRKACRLPRPRPGVCVCLGRSCVCLGRSRRCFVPKGYLILSLENMKIYSWYISMYIHGRSGATGEEARGSVAAKSWDTTPDTRATWSDATPDSPDTSSPPPPTPRHAATSPDATPAPHTPNPQKGGLSEEASDVSPGALALLAELQSPPCSRASNPSGKRSCRTAFLSASPHPSNAHALRDAGSVGAGIGKTD